MMQIRVLHLLRTDRFSGAENVVCQIIAAFLQNPEVDMVYCSPDGEIRGALSERSIPFLPLENFSSASLKKAIADYRPTVIHAHDGAASVLAAHVAKNIKIISQMHGNHENMRKISVKSLLFRLYSRRFSHIFWVNDSAEKDYRFASSVKNKSSILNNVISIEALLSAASGEAPRFDIIFLGRLSYPKNPLRLIDVFSKVAQRCPDVTLAIVGDGELRAEVEGAVAEKALHDRVTFLGFQSNPQPILKNATMMLMTSRYEGIPMCALEAMALGVPTVSTPTDGLSQLVDHGENGYLSGDDDALAAYCAKLIGDEALRARFSESCKAKARVWNDLSAYADKILHYYK